MDIQILKATTETNLEQVRDLYLGAFPANERRRFEGFLQQLQQKKSCSVFLAMQGPQNLGFFTLWDFNSFVFIEHLAVWPAFRGRRIGEGILQWVLTHYHCPVILEVEPPQDEMTRRRVAFYRRNGFFLLDYNYSQPSYDGIIPGPVLNLMCSVPNPISLLVEEFFLRTKEEVYGP